MVKHKWDSVSEATLLFNINVTTLGFALFFPLGNYEYCTELYVHTDHNKLPFLLSLSINSCTYGNIQTLKKKKNEREKNGIYLYGLRNTVFVRWEETTQKTTHAWSPASIILKHRNKHVCSVSGDIEQI